MSEGTQRRLAAVVSADVAGYSRMMGHDEDGTLAVLKAHRNSIDPLIVNDGGHIVKTTGDGLLIEFSSAFSAVKASLAMQHEMAQRNTSLPEDRRMHFRVGIHVGEIIADDGDIFGDAVNIAARLQELAQPGGITISQTVRDGVHQRLDAPLTDLGRQQLKNILEPVAVWRIEMDDDAKSNEETGTGAQADERAAVAVLPFDNMSADPEQEYFVDGITEDIITALSLRSGLKVIARNSTFVYKGRSQDIKTVAKELDARYVLEGSVRKAGKRVRITAQLIDATNGQHLWAERYDRDLTDIFDLQDEITANISSRVAPQIWRVEGERVSLARPEDLDAWDLYLRALSHYHRTTAEDLHEAYRLLRRSIELDANYAASHSLLAMVLITSAHEGWVPSTADAFREGLEEGAIAIRLGDPDGVGHATNGVIYSLSGQHAQGLESAREGLARNPYAPICNAWMGVALLSDGQLETAMEYLLKAYQLSQNDVHGFHACRGLAYANYLLERYEAALLWADKCEVGLPAHAQQLAIKAAILAQLDRTDEARDYIQRYLEEVPHMTVGTLRTRYYWKNREYVEMIMSGLEKAGLPV
jgi:adenylate cyclase